QDFIDNNKVVIKNNHTSFTFGFNAGVFYPSDVNNYIYSWLENKYGSINSGYNLDIYLNLSLSLGFSHKLNKNLEIKPMIELSMAPKIITVYADDIETYSFNKVSPGVLGLFHIPVGKHKHSLFFGGGVLYNFLSFKEFKDSSLGWRAIGGFSFMNHKNFNPQVFMGWDQAIGKATNNSYNSYINSNSIDLDYSSFKIGTYLNF
ncbi:MAG: hypothetical protein JW717_14640, partial [Marinilabiliaceae bacterium]|nr:hypothetical protein [Marinilabiliaceae bacterium]